MGGSNSTPGSPDASPDMRMVGSIGNTPAIPGGGFQESLSSETGAFRPCPGATDDFGGNHKEERSKSGSKPEADYCRVCSSEEEDEEECDDNEDEEECEEEDSDECEEANEDDAGSIGSSPKPTFLPCRDPPEEDSGDSSDAECSSSSSSSSTSLQRRQAYFPCRDPAGDTDASSDEGSPGTRRGVKDEAHLMPQTKSPRSGRFTPCKDMDRKKPTSSGQGAFLKVRDVATADISPRKKSPCKTKQPRQEKEECKTKREEALELGQANNQCVEKKTSEDACVKQSENESSVVPCSKSSEKETKTGGKSVESFLEEKIKDLQKGCAYLSKKELRKVCEKYKAYGQIKDEATGPVRSEAKQEKSSEEGGGSYAVAYSRSWESDKGEDYSGTFLSQKAAISHAMGNEIATLTSGESRRSRSAVREAYRAEVRPLNGPKMLYDMYQATKRSLSPGKRGYMKDRSSSRESSGSRNSRSGSGRRNGRSGSGSRNGRSGSGSRNSRSGSGSRNGRSGSGGNGGNASRIIGGCGNRGSGESGRNSTRGSGETGERCSGRNGSRGNGSRDGSGRRKASAGKEKQKSKSPGPAMKYTVVENRHTPPGRRRGVTQEEDGMRPNKSNNSVSSADQSVSILSANKSNSNNLDIQEDRPGTENSEGGEEVESGRNVSLRNAPDCCLDPEIDELWFECLEKDTSIDNCKPGTRGNETGAVKLATSGRIRYTEKSFCCNTTSSNLRGGFENYDIAFYGSLNCPHVSSPDDLNKHSPQLQFGTNNTFPGPSLQQEQHNQHDIQKNEQGCANNTNMGPNVPHSATNAEERPFESRPDTTQSAHSFFPQDDCSSPNHTFITEVDNYNLLDATVGILGNTNCNADSLIREKRRRLNDAQPRRLSDAQPRRLSDAQPPTSRRPSQSKIVKTVTVEEEEPTATELQELRLKLEQLGQPVFDFEIARVLGVSNTQIKRLLESMLHDVSQVLQQPAVHQNQDIGQQVIDVDLARDLGLSRQLVKNLIDGSTQVTRANSGTAVYPHSFNVELAMSMGLDSVQVNQLADSAGRHGGRQTTFDPRLAKRFGLNPKQIRLLLASTATQRAYSPPLVSQSPSVTFDVGLAHRMGLSEWEIRLLQNSIARKNKLYQDTLGSGEISPFDVYTARSLGLNQREIEQLIASTAAWRPPDNIGDGFRVEKKSSTSKKDALVAKLEASVSSGDKVNDVINTLVEWNSILLVVIFFMLVATSCPSPARSFFTCPLPSACHALHHVLIAPLGMDEAVRRETGQPVKPSRPWLVSRVWTYLTTMFDEDVPVPKPPKGALYHLMYRLGVAIAAGIMDALTYIYHRVVLPILSLPVMLGGPLLGVLYTAASCTVRTGIFIVYYVCGSLLGIPVPISLSSVQLGTHLSDATTSPSQLEGAAAGKDNSGKKVTTSSSSSLPSGQPGPAVSPRKPNSPPEDPTTSVVTPDLQGLHQHGGFLIYMGFDPPKKGCHYSYLRTTAMWLIGTLPAECA